MLGLPYAISFCSLLVTIKYEISELELCSQILHYDWIAQDFWPCAQEKITVLLTRTFQVNTP